MSNFVFHPIRIAASAPGGLRELGSFDDAAEFLYSTVRRSILESQHWQPVRSGLLHARFGARRAEVYDVLRNALAEEAWLA